MAGRVAERLGISEAGEVLAALGFGSGDIVSLSALSRREALRNVLSKAELQRFMAG